jgi:hypothetical protein
MTPKEKAIELYNKFFVYADSNYGTNRFEQNWYGNVLAGERKVRKKSAKQCALIAVDEIMNVLDKYLPAEYFKVMNYYEEVKQEIEAL